MRHPSLSKPFVAILVLMWPLAIRVAQQGAYDTPLPVAHAHGVSLKLLPRARQLVQDVASNRVRKIVEQVGPGDVWRIAHPK